MRKLDWMTVAIVARSLEGRVTRPAIGLAGAWPPTRADAHEANESTRTFADG